MAKAGSTVAIDANFDAIQNHVNGMSIAGTEALAAEESPVDAISGATLVDTAGYLATILAAAQAINSCAAALFCAPGKKRPPGRQALPGGSVRQKLRVYLKTPQRCSILPKSPICCVAFACIPPRSAALMRLASGAFWRISQHF